MRRLIQIYPLLLCLPLILSQANAKCSNAGLWVFPASHTINQNPVFVLDGFGESQEIVRGLGSSYEIFLESPDHIVKLRVADICVGEFHLTQAILKPEGTLLMNGKYALKISGLPEGMEVNKIEGLPPEYTIADTTDSIKPVLLKQPVQMGKTLRYFGCGREIYVRFSNPVKDQSELLVRTRVRNLATNKVSEYYIAPSGNEIHVGHNMCLGAFAFENGAIYEVEFAFMDASGNNSEWTDKIRFSKPVKQTPHDSD